MPAFYRELLDTDFSALDDLAVKWREAHTKTEKLPKRMMDEVLKPSRDKGYWEGAAAPFAWSLIDDIARQLTASNKVAKALSDVLDDAVSDLKIIRRDLKDAGQGGTQSRDSVRPGIRGCRRCCPPSCTCSVNVSGPGRSAVS